MNGKVQPVRASRPCRPGAVSLFHKVELILHRLKQLAGGHVAAVLRVRKYMDDEIPILDPRAARLHEIVHLQHDGHRIGAIQGNERPYLAIR